MFNYRKPRGEFLYAKDSAFPTEEEYLSEQKEAEEYTRIRRRRVASIRRTRISTKSLVEKSLYHKSKSSATSHK